MKLPRKVESFLSETDFFAADPSVTIQSQRKSSTICGFVLTVLITIGISVTFGLFLKQLFDRSIVNIVTSELQGDKSQIRINQDFKFSVVFFNIRLRQQIIDPSIIQPKALVVGGPNYEYLDMGDCPEGYLPPIAGAIPGAKFWCVKETSQTHPNAKPLIGDVDTQFIEVRVFKCDNSTSNVTCATKEKIDDALQGAYAFLYYSGSTVDLEQYQTPINNTISGTSMGLISDLSKDVYLNIKKIEVETDDDYLLSSSSIERGFTYEPLQYDFSQGGWLISIVMQYKGSIIKYNRRYKKIPELLGEMSGIIGLIIVVFKICMDDFTKLKLYERLISHVFSFEKMVIKKEASTSKEKYLSQKSTKLSNLNMEEDSSVKVNKNQSQSRLFLKKQISNNSIDNSRDLKVQRLNSDDEQQLQMNYNFNQSKSFKESQFKKMSSKITKQHEENAEQNKSIEVSYCSEAEKNNKSNNDEGFSTFDLGEDLDFQVVQRPTQMTIKDKQMETINSPPKMQIQVIEENEIDKEIEDDSPQEECQCNKGGEGRFL